MMCRTILLMVFLASPSTSFNSITNHALYKNVTASRGQFDSMASAVTDGRTMYRREFFDGGECFMTAKQVRHSC